MISFDFGSAVSVLSAIMIAHFRSVVSREYETDNDQPNNYIVHKSTVYSPLIESFIHVIQIITTQRVETVLRS